MLNSKAVCMPMAVMAILTIMSADSASCNWCTAAPDLTACVTDPDGWTLVRAIGPTKGSWFDNVDSLQGTDAAVDNNVDQYNIGSFEAAVSGFNQFLFATGDCSSWLITSKDAIGGPFTNDYYSDSARNVCASSESPTQISTPRWYNRNGAVEDPWISTTDHGVAIAAGDIVYGENNFADTHAATVIAPKQGVYVYIRSKQLDEYGCTVDACDKCGLCDDCIDGECFPKACSDGLYCSGEEYCDPEDGVCKSGEEVDCPANMLCDDNLARCRCKAIERSFGASSGYFAEYKDELIIGLLLTNMVLMVGLIVSCFVLSKGNNKKYSVVSMQESDAEQRALKQ